MGNDQQRSAELIHQTLQHFHDLRLSGNIQRCGGLITDDKLGLAGYGSGDHGALAHTAGHLKRVVLHTGFRVRDAYVRQGLHTNLPGFFFRAFAVLADDFAKLIAHCIHRFQACHGFLEDHSNLGSTHSLHLFRAWAIFQQVFVFQQHFAALDLTRRALHQLHNGHLGHRLAAAGFTNDRYDFVLVYIVRYTVDGFNLAICSKKGGMQVFNFQQFLSHFTASPSVSDRVHRAGRRQQHSRR